MEYNKSPISLREGIVTLDGDVVYDCVKCTIKFTPDVWTGRLLGERTQSSRWLGGSLTGDLTRRRATPFLKEKIQEYLQSGETPEFVIQGLSNDKNSDYYKEYGTDTVTVVGVVLTGDLQLLALDSAGDILDDTIGFNAKDLT